MKYFANYNTLNQELSKSNCQCLNDEFENIEITKEIFDDFENYKYFNGEIIRKSETEIQEEKTRKEQKYIKSLKCTKRVFALLLQELGISYLQLKELIGSNEQATLEWELCVELERSNPLLDIMAAQLNITPEKLDALFLCANKEIGEDDFKL